MTAWSSGIVHMPGLLILLAANVSSLCGFQGDRAPAADAPSCEVVGQIFGSDRYARTFTVKRDAGDLVNFSYDNSTIFLRFRPGQERAGGERVSPGDLSAGDRVCARLSQAGGHRQASRVLVSFRTEIAHRWKTELMRWQAQSVFGVVAALDPQTRRITVTPSGDGSEASLAVDAGGKVVYWRFPRTAAGLSDAVRGSWDKILIGDAIYIRGERQSESGPMLARLIISGGFRSFVGTIEAIDALNGLIRLRDLGSGKTRVVHVSFNDLYVISRPPGSAGSQAECKLYRMSFGDPKPNDSVVAFGKEDGPSDRVHGFALIAGFSSFGAIPFGPDAHTHWIFDALGIGDHE
jgi:hypothetical protein